jgi:aminoacyl tRNA synthase complex-interacting multifunctional protein 1
LLICFQHRHNIDLLAPLSCLLHASATTFIILSYPIHLSTMTGSATAVTSHAAVCQLTVAQSIYDKDALLQIIVKLASSKQVHVSIDKKGNTLQLQYAGHTYTQRNLIIRALSGRVLHYALDQAPFYLMGGSAARASTSHANAMTAGSIVSWMSVADSMRSATASSDDTENDHTAFLESLEAHFETRAFLVPSSQCTVADWDLALALLTQSGGTDPTTSNYGPNVQRWLLQSYASLQAAAVSAGMDISKLPAGLPAPKEAPAPVFFYGTEDITAVLQPKKSQNQSNNNNKHQEGKGKQSGAKQDAKPKGEQQPKEQQQQQQQQPKKGKQPKAGAATGGGGNQEAADFTVAALDIRVGRIIKCWEHAEADKLFCEEIDLGTETRQIASGLRPFYKASDLEGRLVLVLCNLKKRNLVGFPSHGMVLCASNADHTAVETVSPAADSVLGERVTFEGFDGEPEPENKIAKKKVFEKVSPDLQTDATGQVVWKGVLAKTSAGVVKAHNGMAGAQVA